MAAASSTVALPGIAALPPTTARQIGSGQVLVDASSVIKELIDNALDARAKSIFVDIAANTIDTIQVKDDGHGIPSEDRPLLCRRYYTSKIRDLSDLRDVGRRWLGFRGEALSSMAEMSGALMVTTRVEGEPVAVKLKYGRDGELTSIERDSHPVGTTVKATSLFEYIPVRKQAAIKNSAKCLTRIRRLIQAYVLARPGIRFRLRILKAKNNTGDFVYAPKADASMEDAVLKIFGKDCAMQCGSTTVEADGFEICALLPRPTAVGSKIASYGSFVSVDARPMSSNRGTAKQLIRACKDRLGQVNASVGGVRDPFLCVNINCPPRSYDANIEPAKDDVLFENSDAVLSVLDKLLKSYYPEAVTNIDNDELSLSAPQDRQLEPDEVLAQEENNLLPQGYNISNRDEAASSTPQPRWRYSMYGIDEDNLEFLQDDLAPIVDEEEGRRAVEVSNPWTIARMNASIKPRQSASNLQLPSPAKSIKDFNGYSSPSKMPTTPSRIMPAGPLTPQTSSKTNTIRSPLDNELERSIQRLAQPGSVTGSVNDWPGERRRKLLSDDGSSGSLEAELLTSVSQPGTQALDNWASSSARDGEMDSGMTTSADQTPHPQQPTQDPKLSEPVTRQKRVANPELPYSQTSTSSRSRKSLPVAARQTAENRLYSNNNKDIRDCFKQRSQVLGNNLAQEHSFTPIDRQPQSVPPRPLSLSAPVNRNRPPQNGLDALRADSAGPRNIRDYLQAYSERAGARLSSPAESQTSMPFDRRPATIHQFPVYQGDSVTSSAFHAPSPQAERPSPAFPQSNTLSAPRNTSRSNQRSQSTDQMTAFFQSHLENLPIRPPQHAHHTTRPDKKSYQHHNSPHTITTVTSNPINLSAHLKLLLHNRTLSLSVTTTVEDIIRHALTRHDHLPKWDCAAQDAYSGFSEQVSEERIGVWVCRLDNMLCVLYERVGGMRETRGVLEDGVKRALEGVREGVSAGYEAGSGEGEQGCGGFDDDDFVAEDDVEEEMLMDS